jgi:hypothetical protein
MIYKKVTIWFKDNGSIVAVNYERVGLTISGNYLILSLHNDDSTEVTTEIHELGTIKNWKSFVN